jgi:YHS domain-containing protein
MRVISKFAVFALPFAAAALVAAFTFAVVEKAEEAKPQTACPVGGRDIDKGLFLDYQGQRIYFCCAGCPAKFKADPEKYFARIAEAGVVLENVQKKCPVMGGKPDPEVFRDYKGRRVLFCCPACLEKFEKDPEKYLAKLGPTDEGEGAKKREQGPKTCPTGCDDCGSKTEDQGG